VAHFSLHFLPRAFRTLPQKEKEKEKVKNQLVLYLRVAFFAVIPWIKIRKNSNLKKYEKTRKPRKTRKGRENA
jgi:hypothetical protein